jgi:hypothetical protein
MMLRNKTPTCPFSYGMLLGIFLGGVLMLGILLVWESGTVAKETSESLPKPAPSVRIVRSEPSLSAPASAMEEGNQFRKQAKEPTVPVSERVVTNGAPIEEFVPPPPVPGLYSSALRSHPELIQDSERFTALAEEFVAKVKAAGWDTTTDQYKKAWKEASRDSDDMLRNLIGEQAFIMIKTEQSRE